MAKQLAKLGVDIIEAGFPIASPGDFDAVKRIAESVGRGSNPPIICGLARALKKDIEARATFSPPRPNRAVFPLLTCFPPPSNNSP